MNRLKIILLNWILRNLYNTITADDILIYNAGKFIVAGKELPEADRTDIITGADAIRKMFVWELLARDMKFQANKLIFEKQETIDDAIFGKAVLFVIDVLEKKLKNLSEIK